MSIDRLDVPAAQVASDMAALIARQRQQRLDEELRLVQAHDLDAYGDAAFQHIAINWGRVSLVKKPRRTS
ncbi:hypothetical protein OG897_13270 [Streptomyces sp. NBC_00237]|uniref:hypothetical protein n=1 Tax=Streptomyces sp. NBC_00237 TaxID=2975687 RepID=UPI002259FC6E|nr:hypothetical protein [Streptomyces sp. NBC_00237]MCX5202413.1 hypothetical protein [Streptomyces sp. NBC_00237]